MEQTHQMPVGDDLKYARLLSQRFPNRQATMSEIINLHE